MSPTTHDQRLALVRAELAHHNLDCLIVRGTDRYLNEYVPEAESTRVWLTGFTGSTGDALVSHDKAWLFVDGRYYVQAGLEVDPDRWEVVRVTLGETLEAACAQHITKLTSDKTLRVGFESDRFALKPMTSFVARLEGARVDMVPIHPSPVEALRGPVEVSGGSIRAINEASVGRSVAQKITLAAQWLSEHRADALLVSRLDEIAWLTNLRGNELPYQATFRAIAAVTPTSVLLAVDSSVVSDALREQRPDVSFVSREGLFNALGALGAPPRIAIDPASCSVALENQLLALSPELLRASSPLLQLKSIKTKEELQAMTRALGRADRVVADAQTWLTSAVTSGARVTEADFARKVEELFFSAGAVGLSFSVISASGPNGAVVHHPPSESDVVREGELMLLDTGCYFEEGYATDLTRTFFVGREGSSPTSAQQRLFTLTLKAAIAGMSARIARGAVGAQLDGITRRPLWAVGFDYAHGTGHGVGINVHEAPPRIANISVTPVQEGQVFSIEPGIYQEGVGGVRIENLCTAVADPEHPDFLKVVPLTFSPLDARLIDHSLLNPEELAFLAEYSARWEFTEGDPALRVGC